MQIFQYVPLNRSKVYVQGKTQNGCEIYFPIINSASEEHIQAVKVQLQKELDNQFNVPLALQ